MKENEFIRTRVAMVIVRDGEILLVGHQNHGHRYWVLPGGGLEYGETLAACGRREELREETGLEIKTDDFLFASEAIPSVTYGHVVILHFEGTVTGGTLRLGDDPVLTEARWHPLADLPELNLFPDTKEELLAAIQGQIPHRNLGVRNDGVHDLRRPFP